jgi:hypothetical protein
VQGKDAAILSTLQEVTVETGKKPVLVVEKEARVFTGIER